MVNGGKVPWQPGGPSLQVNFHIEIEQAKIKRAQSRQDCCRIEKTRTKDATFGPFERPQHKQQQDYLQCSKTNMELRLRKTEFKSHLAGIKSKQYGKDKRIFNPKLPLPKILLFQKLELHLKGGFPPVED